MVGTFYLSVTGLFNLAECAKVHPCGRMLETFLHFKGEQYSILWSYSIVLPYPPINEHLGCLPVLTVVTNTATNVSVQGPSD